jgi:signal transduction histidine kinase
LHGGTLAIASVVGKGTTVRIRFPATRALRTQPAPQFDSISV